MFVIAFGIEMHLAWFRSLVDVALFAQVLGMDVQPGVPMIDPKPSSLKFVQANYGRHVGCFWKDFCQAPT